MSTLPLLNITSPVSHAFAQIQWDPLGALRLTGQETALLRMAETNPLEYTLADPRDASMYARLLLKLITEANLAGSNQGEVSRLSNCSEGLSEADAVQVLDRDPLGVVMHYALTKLAGVLEFLAADSTKNNKVTIANVFYVGKEGILLDQWKALLRLLSKSGKGDAFAQIAAATCLASILVVSFPSQKYKCAGHDRAVNYQSANEPLEALIAWIVAQLKISGSASSSGSASNNVSLCIPALLTLVNCTESRIQFAAYGGIKYLCRHMNARKGGSAASGKKDMSQKEGSPTASVQQLYELSFCLWTLTYELNQSHEIRADFLKDGNAVLVLVDLVTLAPREKIVRVALSALRNLATCVSDIDPAPAGGNKIDGSSFLGEMDACGLMKGIGNLKERQWKDPDILDDINVLHKLLVENHKEMTRWDVYKNEVEMGHLQWGSTHTEAFFKENAKMFEGADGDFSLLKKLIALISSNDDEIVAIACHDVGEFCRHYPNGRQIVRRLGAKDLVMPLIEHDNVDLQRQALQCVSKIMVQNWEYVK